MTPTPAARSPGQATLISGLLGSGKTWTFIKQVLEAANTQREEGRSEASLLALTSPGNLASLQERVDLERPLGCTICHVQCFPMLVRAIVREYGPTVGEYSGSRYLDRRQLAVFLHQNLDTLPLGRFYPRHAPADAVKPLVNFLSSLANLGVTPEDYTRYVEALEAEVGAAGNESVMASPSSHQRSGKGLDKQSIVDSRLQRAELEANAWRDHVAGERDKANVYEAFSALKRREEVRDYSDDLLWARRVLRDSAAARAGLCLRFSNVFVDDIHMYSPVMIDVLSMLVAPGARITATIDPFLTATGVAIGGVAHGPETNPAALLKKAFPDTREVCLDGSHHVVANDVQAAMKRLAPRDAPVVKKKRRTRDKRCVAVDFTECKDQEIPDENDSTTQNDRERGQRMTCLTFRSQDDELRALGLKIRRLVEEGISSRDIGVAAFGPAHTCSTIIAALRAAGVTAESDDSGFSSIFEHKSPRLLMSFLRCLLHPSESTSLLHMLLACPAYALPEGELTAALEGHLSRYISLRTFLEGAQLSEGIPAGHGKSQLSAAARAVATRLISDVNFFAEMAKKKGVRPLMLDFLRHTGLLDQLEEPTTPEEEQEGCAVAEFFEMTALAENHVAGDSAFLVEPILRLFRRHGASGVSPSASFEQDNMGEPSFAPLAENKGVHGAVRVFRPGSKTLSEQRWFHTVFVPGCSRAHLPGSLRTASLCAPGPFRDVVEPRNEESIRSIAQLTRAFHENTARAMLYMAIGSAREEVCFSVSARVTRGARRLAPSPLLAEVLGPRAPREGKMSSVDVELSDRGRNTNVDNGDDPRSRVREDAPDALKPLRLSFSSISAYSTCPYSFFLKYVLNVSPPPNPRMVYGRAMHEAVAMLLRGASAADAGGAPPTLEAAVEEFRDKFQGCAFESRKQHDDLVQEAIAGLESFVVRLLEGRTGLTRLVGGVDKLETTPRDADAPPGNSQPQLLVERKFVVKIPEARVVLSGIFDRVDVVHIESEGAPTSPYVSITDYKSSVGSKDPARMAQNNLQLRVYALAAERLFGVLPGELAIESIEDGRRGVGMASRADVELALEAISAAAAQVRTKDFGATPSFQACTFCGFKHMCKYSDIKTAALN